VSRRPLRYDVSPKPGDSTRSRRAPNAGRPRAEVGRRAGGARRHERRAVAGPSAAPAPLLPPDRNGAGRSARRRGRGPLRHARRAARDRPALATRAAPPSLRHGGGSRGARRKAARTGSPGRAGEAYGPRAADGLRPNGRRDRAGREARRRKSTALRRPGHGPRPGTLRRPYCDRQGCRCRERRADGSGKEPPVQGAWRPQARTAESLIRITPAGGRIAPWLGIGGRAPVRRAGRARAAGPPRGSGGRTGTARA